MPSNQSKCQAEVLMTITVFFDTIHTLIYRGRSSLVERLLAKEKAVGPIPIARSE